jgi:hypothetical protein
LRNRDGSIRGLDVVNGATIKLLIDFKGHRPQAPAPAHMQVIHGRPWRLLSTEDMIYGRATFGRRRFTADLARSSGSGIERSIASSRLRPSNRTNAANLSRGRSWWLLSWSSSIMGNSSAAA